MFKESPRRVYKNNPLKEVVWQAKFPPILSIAVNQPVEFQDSIRKEFPHYSSESSFEIPADQLKLFRRAGLEVEGKRSHKFATRLRDVTVTLTDQFIAVSTNKYSDWDSLLGPIRDALDSFCEIYEPAFFSRLGLRYINIFEIGPLGLADVPWRELVREQFLGPLVDQESAESVAEFRAMALFDMSDPEGSSARVSFGLETKDQFRLDSDLSIQGEFEKGQLYDFSSRFNTRIGHIFRSAITERLDAALDPIGS